MHQVGYSFNGDAPIGGLLQVEADALVLGHLMHNDVGQPSDGSDSLKAEYRRNHRQETARMLDEIADS